MRTILLGLVFVLALPPSTAGQEAALKWTTPLGGVPRWFQLAPDGTPVVAVDRDSISPQLDTLRFTTLKGVDPATGKIKWTYRTSTPRSIGGIGEVPNLPYIIVRGVPLTIIDPSDGHTIIDAVRDQLSNIIRYGFLLQSGHLWIEANAYGKKGLTLFELSTGKKLWTRSDYFVPPDPTKLKTLDAVRMVNIAAKRRLLCAPINSGDESIIIAVGDAIQFNDLYQLSTSTGDVIWKTEAPNPNKGKLVYMEVDTSFTRLIAGPDHFFYTKTAYIAAVGYNDGKPAWPNVVKTSGKIGKIIYDSRGLILCSESKDVNSIISTGHILMVNEQTGAELWPKSLKVNGGIGKHVYTTKGLAMVMENAEAGANAVNFIDVAAGTFVLPKHLKIAGKIIEIELVGKGLFFVTDRSMNIIGLDGTMLMTLPVQSRLGDELAYDHTKDKGYFYADQDRNLYEIDKHTATARMINKAPIEFKGGEWPDYVEAREQGVMVYSKQNIAFLNFDGTVRFNVFNQSVSGFRRKLEAFAELLKVVMDVTKDIVITATTENNALNRPGISDAEKAQIRNDVDFQRRAIADVGIVRVSERLQVFNSLKFRYRATDEAGDALTVLTKIDKHQVLALVNKDTGLTTSSISMVAGDDQPRYEIDPASKLLFYVPRGVDMIKCYSITMSSTQKK